MQAGEFISHRRVGRQRTTDAALIIEQIENRIEASQLTFTATSPGSTNNHPIKK
jgi:hypothetical protein